MTGAASAAGLGVRAGAEGRGRRAGGGGRRRPGGGGGGRAGGAAPPALPSPPLSAGGAGPAGGGKLGREVSGGRPSSVPRPPPPARFPSGGERPCGVGGAGKGVGWLREGGGEWPRGRAFQLHTKGSGQGRGRGSPRGCEGLRARRARHPGGEGAGSPERALSPPPPGAV